MGEFLGIENSALKFVIAFVLVMALIGLTAWLIRQFSSARPNSAVGARNRQPRLAVLDSAVVDARRRLVLIRRDNVEHLLMIGGPTDVVVEANVVRAQPASAPVVPPRAAPQRAPIEPIEPDYDPSLVPFDEPYYEEPAPRPARERPAPAVRAPAPAAAAAAPAPRAAAPRPAPAVEPRVTPAPSSRQAQFSDMTQRLEAALRAPADARPAHEPRIAPGSPSFAAREEPKLSKPEPEPAADNKAGDVFSSLEEEMANLLKPSGGKDSA
jgi:hypothetical protein